LPRRYPPSHLVWLAEELLAEGVADRNPDQAGMSAP
jgi:hypothetical protein